MRETRSAFSLIRLHLNRKPGKAEFDNITPNREGSSPKKQRYNIAPVLILGSL